MSSRRYFLVSFLFLAFLSVNVWAVEIYWDGEADDNLWCTPENWEGDEVPYTPYDRWMSGEMEWDLNDPYIDDPNLASPVIIDGNCDPCTCSMVVVGGYKDIGVGLRMIGGLFRPLEIVIGYWQSGSGTMIMDGGVIDMWDYSYLGVGDGGQGELIMNGGEINCLGYTAMGDLNLWDAYQWAGRLLVPKGEKAAGSGHLQLNGGIIRCRAMSIGEGGTVDIAGGTIVLTIPDHWYGDQEEWVYDWMGNGSLTAYGGDPRAEISAEYEEGTGYLVLSAFTYDLGQAYNPHPRRGERDVSPTVRLRWNPGDYVDTHDVYFGTDKSAVEDATNSPGVWEEYKGNYDVNSWAPGRLEFDKTYYWRVDEVNDANANSPWKGLVWRFRTSPYVLIEDFDSYEDDDDLWDVWSDYWTNGTGAEVYLETADANFIIDGNSMMYEYDNGRSPYYYSESTRIFESSMDWVAGGIKALVLWFHGEPGNDAERMYLRVTDGGSPRGEATIVYADPNDLIQEPEDAWHEWNIDLSDANFSEVDLSDVNSITIGFGDRDNPQPGPEGYVYFEDIRLYPTRCRWDLSSGYGDLTGDCRIDNYDLPVMSGEWLKSDYETVGYTGILTNFLDDDSQWVSGYIDGGLAVDGNDDYDYVEVPDVDFEGASNMTITAWVMPDGNQLTYAGVVYSRDASGDASGLGYGSTGNPDWLVNHELGYCWNEDQKTWSWHSDIFIPTNEWSFIAVVVEPTQATVYLYDGTSLSSAVNEIEHTPLEQFNWDCRNEVGSDGKDVYFNGILDDVRIYDFNMPASDISDLAHGTAEPVPGPRLWYRFDETSGLIAADSGTSTEATYHSLDSIANLVPKEGPYGWDPEDPDIIDFRDYAVLADSWLAEILWP